MKFMFFIMSLGSWNCPHIQTPLKTMHTTPYTNSSQHTAHNFTYNLHSRHCTQLHIRLSCDLTFTSILCLILTFTYFLEFFRGYKIKMLGWRFWRHGVLIWWVFTVHTSIWWRKGVLTCRYQNTNSSQDHAHNTIYKLRSRHCTQCRHTAHNSKSGFPMILLYLLFCSETLWTQSKYFVTCD